jgi:Lipid A 3-O-deacylase (PagL)
LTAGGWQHIVGGKDTCGVTGSFVASDYPRQASRLCFIAILIFLGLGSTSPGARGQTLPGNNEFGIWGAYSTNSPHVWGSLGQGQLGVVAFRYARTLSTRDSYSLQYTIDIAPLAVVRQSKFDSCVVLINNEPALGFCPHGGETVYGGAVNPIGLKLNFRPRRQWQPFGALSCGLVATTRPIPQDQPGIDQFNFTAEGQVGIEHFNSARTRAWRAGYKFQHISNGGLGRVNPGLNLNLLFFGYSLFR